MSYSLDNLHYPFIISIMIDLKMIGLSLNYPDRPVEDTFKNSNGVGDWVFMHFTTPFRVHTPKGMMECSAGEILINSPDYPQWHQGNGSLCNRCPGQRPSLQARLGVPRLGGGAAIRRWSAFAAEQIPSALLTP